MMNNESMKYFEINKNFLNYHKDTKIIFTELKNSEKLKHSTYKDVKILRQLSNERTCPKNPMPELRLKCFFYSTRMHSGKNI